MTQRHYTVVVDWVEEALSDELDADECDRLFAEHLTNPQVGLVEDYSRTEHDGRPRSDGWPGPFVVGVKVKAIGAATTAEWRCPLT